MIRIILPPKSLYTFDPVVLHDMEDRQELVRGEMGRTILLTGENIDLGVAWGRGNTPPVKLRFVAQAGHVYRLFWLTEGFGAGMGVIDMNQGLLHR